MKTKRKIFLLLFALVSLLLCTDIKKTEAAENNFSIEKSKYTLYLNGTKTVQLKVVTNILNSEITWSSNKPQIAKVDQSGKVTGLKTGKAVITAKMGSKTAKCTIIVRKMTISLNIADSTLYVGKTLELKAAVIGPSQKVTWKSSDGTVASVSSSGKVKAKKAGKVTITATANKVSAKCTITVKKVSSIKLNKTSITLSLGGTETAQLKATVTGTSKKVTWSSSDSSIVTVSSTGKVKAKKAGKAIVTAKANGKKARCVVTVKQTIVYLQDVERTASGKAKSSASDRPGDNYDKGGYDYFGNYYQYAYRFDGSTQDWATYNLSKKYSTFEGIIATGRQVAPDTRYTGSGANINVYIYGDGQLLYAYTGLTLYSQPVSFKIDVSDVSSLYIYATNSGAYYCGWMYFCNSYFTVK